jgi:cytidyltransferase-like protein
MKKILSIKEAAKVAKEIKKQGKTIVVAGGFFDILHLGHIKFLKESKKYGDYLFVLLEENSKATLEKGKKRPINSQNIRAKILSSLKDVSYIVMLKNMTKDDLYDKIIIEIRPNVISTTSGDPNVHHKKRQAKLIQAKIIYALERIDNYSTTAYEKLI